MVRHGGVVARDGAAAFGAEGFGDGVVSCGGIGVCRHRSCDADLPNMKHRACAVARSA